MTDASAIGEAGPDAGRNKALRAGLSRSLRWGLLAVAPLLAALLSLDGQALAQTQTPKPVINIASVILVEPASETAFPIPVGPADAIPRHAFVRVRGLPRTVSFSEGHEIAAGAWAIPLSALSTLKITSPVGSDGKAQIAISLVTLEGQVLSEAKATLLIMPAAQLAAGQPRQGAPTQSMAATVTGRTERRETPPVMQSGPQLSPDDLARARKLMQKGDENINAGNVTVARLFYQRSAEVGYAPAALALAMTFDPHELARWKVIGGVQPDPEKARKWYEKARELGAAEAAARLDRLSAR